MKNNENMNKIMYDVIIINMKIMKIIIMMKIWKYENNEMKM